MVFVGTYKWKSVEIVSLSFYGHNSASKANNSGITRYELKREKRVRELLIRKKRFQFNSLSFTVKQEFANSLRYSVCPKFEANLRKVTKKNGNKKYGGVSFPNCRRLFSIENRLRILYVWIGRL